MALSDTAVTANNITASSGVAASTTAFSPGAGSMVVVMVSYLFSTGATATLTCKDSSGTAYTSAVQQQNSFGNEIAAVFTHVYAAAPGSITVAVTCSNTGAANCLISPRIITGQAASPLGATVSADPSGSITAISASITTTAPGSLVYIAATIQTGSVLTALGNTTTIATAVTGFNNAGTGRTTAFTVTPGATTVGWTCSPASAFGDAFAALEVLPAPHTAAAAMSGSGSMGGTGTSALLSFAALNGTGTLAATPGGSGLIAMDGEGVLGAAGLVTLFTAGLSGAGAMGAMPAVTYLQSAALDGTGTMSVSIPTAHLDGEGTLGITGLRLGYVIGLTGIGSIAVIQVSGGLVSGSGGVPSPQAMPGSSQVAVAAPGSSNWQYLGTIGQVTALTYSFTCPGGCDQMTATVMVPASYRTQLFNPGWQVRITRGGHQVWTGKLDEPVPTSQGWTLSAVGTGNRGTDFTAIYTSTWPNSQPDEIINAAISRGLPWVNPGQNSSQYASQFWFGQQTDPGSTTVAAFLTLLCTRGGLTWYVNSQPGGRPGDDLTIFPVPAVPNRLLVCTTPVPRTLGGDINSIYIRYMSSADNAATGAVAAYSTVLAQNAASVTAHGVLETYVDLSDVGVMSSGAAQGVGTSILAAYVRASYAGPFTASYGQLLTTGGTPIDPGTDQAGTVCQLLLTDFAYGGEVTPGPVTFPVGSYEWDDFAQVATISPYQILDESLSGMLSTWNTVNTPAAVAGG